MLEKDFVNKFLSVFAKDVNEQQKRKNRIGGKHKGYLWNLFGTKFVSYLEGNDARAEYDIVDKTGAVEILYDSPCLSKTFEIEVLNVEHMTSAGIDNSGLVEFYIIGNDFSWCYVVTHAGDAAGPYLCYAS